MNFLYWYEKLSNLVNYSKSCSFTHPSNHDVIIFGAILPKTLFLLISSESCPEDTGKCESLMICNDMKCNDIVGSQSEIIPGWTNDGLDAGPWRLPKWDYVWEVCGKDEAWYGWKLHSGVGSISTTFTASGSAELSFGNCWAFGTVQVYLDDIEIASAGPIEHKAVVFDFQTGAVLSIHDEGDNSIIQISKFEILTCI